MGAGTVGSEIRVALIEDHPVVIEGIESWLAQEPRINVVYAGDDPNVLSGEAGLHADVVLLDLNLGGKVDLETIVRLAATDRQVIVYSQFTKQSLIMQVLECGAREFIAKQEGREHLVNAVVAVVDGEPYVGPTMAGALISAGDAAPRLSEQERTALLLWFQSSSKGSVARRMDVSPHTVDMYIRRARRKYAELGRPAFTKAELLARAIEDSLVVPDGNNPEG